MADAATSGNATGSGRTKVALKPGRSLMHWIRLGSTTPDLAGTNGQIIQVKPSMLAAHKTQDEAVWIALKGKVYNITPYLEFHPGGESELMKGAGKDATDLFNKVHPWVNYEGMLKKCLVGPLVPEHELSEL